MHMDIYQRNQLWASLSQELVKPGQDLKHSDKAGDLSQAVKAKSKRDKKV